MFETVNDITFHIDLQEPVNGLGLALLHLHGTNLHLWDPQIGALARQYCVLRIDLRGHGLTSTGASSLTINDLAGDVLALTDRFGFKQFSVAGVSLGGMIAQQLADEAPGHIDAIIMIDTSAIPLFSPAWLTTKMSANAALVIWSMKSCQAGLPQTIFILRKQKVCARCYDEPMPKALHSVQKHVLRLIYANP